MAETEISKHAALERARKATIAKVKKMGYEETQRWIVAVPRLARARLVIAFEARGW